MTVMKTILWWDENVQLYELYVYRFKNLYVISQKCIARIKHGLKDLQKREPKDQETQEVSDKSKWLWIFLSVLFLFIHDFASEN